MLYWISWTIIKEGQKKWIADWKTSKKAQKADKQVGKSKDILLRMEQKYDKKLATLFDKYSVNYDKTTEAEKELEAFNKADCLIKFMMDRPKAANNSYIFQ